VANGQVGDRLESQNKNPVFILYPWTRVYIGIIILMAIPVVTILSIGSLLTSYEFVAVLFLEAVPAAIVASHREYLFFNDFLHIKGIAGISKIVSYENLVIVDLPKYPKGLNLFLPKVVLKAKDNKIMKPLEIRSNPYNDKIAMDFLNWLRVKVPHDN
jgi:hypothetical protein